MKHELPAKLAFVEIDRTTTRDAAHDTDAVIAAIVEIDLTTQVLMPADQGRRRKAQKPNRVGNAIGLPLLDQGGVEGDVGTAFADTSVNDSKCIRHCRWKPARLFDPDRDIQLFANLLDVLLDRLKRITRNIRRRRIAIGPVAG